MKGTQTFLHTFASSFCFKLIRISLSCRRTLSDFATHKSEENASTMAKLIIQWEAVGPEAVEHNLPTFLRYA